ncbi:MAG: hypothetical protein AAF658_01600, partial [Myxococcota bacterium]
VQGYIGVVELPQDEIERLKQGATPRPLLSSLLSEVQRRSAVKLSIVETSENKEQQYPELEGQTAVARDAALATLKRFALNRLTDNEVPSYRRN